jgi:hypothetical protein
VIDGWSLDISFIVIIYVEKIKQATSFGKRQLCLSKINTNNVLELYVIEFIVKLCRENDIRYTLWL